MDIDFVEGTYLHPFMKSTRCGGVVEPDHACGGGLADRVIGRNALQFRRHVGWRHRGLAAVRRLRPEKLRAECFEAVPHCELALGQRRGTACRTVDHVQVARRENAALGWIVATDEGIEVREEPVGRNVGSARPPKAAARRVDVFQRADWTPIGAATCRSSGVLGGQAPTINDSCRHRTGRFIPGRIEVSCGKLHSAQSGS